MNFLLYPFKNIYSYFFPKIEKKENEEESAELNEIKQAKSLHDEIKFFDKKNLKHVEINAHKKIKKKSSLLMLLQKRMSPVI